LHGSHISLPNYLLLMEGIDHRLAKRHSDCYCGNFIPLAAQLLLSADIRWQPD
jgi:hypothetical protein